MRQTTKSITLVSLFLLSLFSGMVIGTEQAEASQVVITEAVRIVDGGTASDNQAAVASDSEGNVHIVWARNTQHLYYSMLSPRGETLIDATQITNPGLHKVWPGPCPTTSAEGEKTLKNSHANLHSLFSV